MNEGVATDEYKANTSHDYHEYIFREVEYKRMTRSIIGRGCRAGYRHPQVYFQQKKPKSN